MLAQMIHAEQIGHDLPGRIAAELQDLADGVDAEDPAGGVDVEDHAHVVEPHAVRRATTPGAWHRTVTLTPLLEDWNDSGWQSISPCGHAVGRQETSGHRIGLMPLREAWYKCRQCNVIRRNTC